MSYDGDSITYDQIGNPLTYRDNMSFTWNGRQMATANLNGTTVEYKYDADGLRNYKKVGNTVHEYEYVGGQLVYEKRGDLKFYYRYNAMGELASIKRIDTSENTETSVYVITNTRGDIEELRLANGDLVARYVYDTWGNTINIVYGDSEKAQAVKDIAVQNPFRYRSYYYDAESGLYYLQSRYYDPVTCRFLNADVLLSTETVLGFNLFVYCINNPVMHIDYTGERYFECCPYGCVYCKNNGNSSIKKDNLFTAMKKTIDSTSFKIGGGFGFGGSIDLGIGGIEVVAKENLLEIEINSSTVNLNTEVSIGGEINSGPFKLYSYNRSKTNYITGEVLYDGLDTDLIFDTIVTYGGSAYFILGYEYEISYDIAPLIEYVVYLFEE